MQRLHLGLDVLGCGGAGGFHGFRFDLAVFPWGVHCPFGVGLVGVDFVSVREVGTDASWEARVEVLGSCGGIVCVCKETGKAFVSFEQ